MDNIIPIEDLPDFIDATIAKVNEGVALARRRGILAELPKEVQFNVILVKKWQDPDHVAIGTEKTTGSDTGSSTSTSTQKSTGKRSSEDGSSTQREGVNIGTTAGQNVNYTYTE